MYIFVPELKTVRVCLSGSFEEAEQAMEFAQAKIHSLATFAREVRE